MDSSLVSKRVESMEMTLQTLRAIPGRIASIDVQLLQFREEVRVELSALRRDVRQLAAEFSGLAGSRAVPEACSPDPAPHDPR